MKKVVLGKTGLTVNKNGFGALPIQRITKSEAVYLLQKAFYHGRQLFRYSQGVFGQRGEAGSRLLLYSG